ncbi:DUF5133 domain-containing protein [Streptomyces jeddahensis]|uniref:DUF5133 domain-containing protein n=1 Tax=Streptomyces jeddahensis TaxID=1716141 RepID=A0A177HMM3_9ACTN|nr:DUF5133 domain-containing protein [Streptomyces jeddahensis]OAH12241.1 hypothetical protein STSP_44360 [Streptomyces jeddahensis]
MPLIDFHVLRELVAEHDRLTDGLLLASGTPEWRRRLEDLQYTVCVYTGVRDPQQALSHARRLLADRARRAEA